MANLHFDIKNGSNWLDLPVPSALSFSYEDVDNDSYRSVITGNLIRRPISYKWRKVSVGYRYLEEDKSTVIMDAFENKKEVTVRYMSPKGVETRVGYISKCESEYIQRTQGHGYTLSFNWVESRR